MKKTYIEPKTECVIVKCGQLLQAVSGDGLNMRINSSSVEGAGDSRGGGSFWDDED